MFVEIAWKQNILVTDFHLLKSPLVVFGFGWQAFVCEYSRQNICSAGFQKDKFCQKHFRKLYKNNTNTSERIRPFFWSLQAYTMRVPHPKDSL